MNDDVRSYIDGWQQDRDGGFTERHPDLRTSKGTIRLRPQDAAALADGELLALVRAALDEGRPDECRRHRI